MTDPSIHPTDEPHRDRYDAASETAVDTTSEDTTPEDTARDVVSSEPARPGAVPEATAHAESAEQPSTPAADRESAGEQAHTEEVQLTPPAEETPPADEPVAADAAAHADEVSEQEEAEPQAEAEETAEPAEEPAAEVPEPAEISDADTASTEPQEAEQAEAGEPVAEAAAETAAEEGEESHRDWYILKVQSNREDSIRDGLLRRVKIAGLEEFFGEVIVPTEMVTEFKNGKKRVVRRKLYPGYIVVNMEVNDDTWFLVRDTPGIGDFTGAGGSPVPMLPHEVSRLLATEEEKTEQSPKLKIAFKPGDRVKINEGTFKSFEGEVESIDEANGRVTVMINIFGRSTPVELEYWQIESV